MSGAFQSNAFQINAFQAAAPPSYFMPPTETIVPPKRYFQHVYNEAGEMSTIRPETGYVFLHAHRRAVQRPSDPMGYYTVGAYQFRGGYWNGPLTDAQIAAITSAGMAARIVAATDPGFLPAGID